MSTEDRCDFTPVENPPVAWSGCFICRPEDASVRDVEGCPACEADFGNYVRSLYEAGVLTDAE